MSNHPDGNYAFPDQYQPNAAENEAFEVMDKARALRADMFAAIEAVLVKHKQAIPQTGKPWTPLDYIMEGVDEMLHEATKHARDVLEANYGDEDYRPAGDSVLIAAAVERINAAAR